MNAIFDYENRVPILETLIQSSLSPPISPAEAKIVRIIDKLDSMEQRPSSAIEAASIFNGTKKFMDPIKISMPGGYGNNVTNFHLNFFCWYLNQPAPGGPTIYELCNTNIFRRSIATICYEM